ncbi:YhdH/YhfP family quinone oxidoreductase [Candidatus Solincola tengchongensis]|uniref:YhdH/YhfP family quinone oxidoreductase n=1 Tax=Candidatus Solincola tengchongensis TaxID=2900693 RepID=UPI00257BB5BD|nr:YhdH/YhfP family quinone oxidoreductase [Candidatus Solincola tengchongensis]
MGKTFRAIVVREREDGTFTRSIETRDTDELPPGEVLIRVHYTSVNYKDALSAIGNRGVTKNYPHTPGIDAAGVVEESSSADFKPGEEVLVTGYDLGMNTSGGMAEYIRVPASWVVRLPAGLSLKESMIYGTAGFTAALSVYKLTGAGVRPDAGEVLVTGASGGVGSLALRFLAKLGYRVVAAAGLVEESEYPRVEEKLKSLGASRVIPASEVNDTSGKLLLKGIWPGAVDTVGGNVLATVVKQAAYLGVVTTCGNTGGHELNLNVYPFILRGVTLIGIDSVECPMDLRLQVWEKMAGEWKPDNLEDFATEITLEQVEERFRLLLDKKSQGRAVVRVQ